MRTKKKAYERVGIIRDAFRVAIRLDSNAAGLRLQDRSGQTDLSPRLSTSEMHNFLDGFESGMLNLQKLRDYRLSEMATVYLKS